MGEWIDCTLGDVLTLQRGFDLPVQDRRLGMYPVIASTGQVGTHDNAQVTGPGVVIGRSGSIGGGQFIPRDFWPLNTTLWVADFKGNDPRFCYYLLRSIDFSQFNVGSGVPTLNRNHVHPLPVRVPPLGLRKRVGEILGALDDKIELNRRTNETLEAMAQAIFRDWFVDFGPVRRKLAGERDPVAIMGGLVADAERAAKLAALFPDELDAQDRPVDWTEHAIGDLSEAVGGSTPSTANEEFWQPPVHAWVTPKDLSTMNDLALFETNRRISDNGLAVISSGLLPRGTVLLSSRAPIGYLAIAQMPVAVNQGFIALKPNDRVGSAFLYLWCKENLPVIIANANGSTFQEISKRNFRPIPVVLPEKNELLAEFDNIASPLIDRLIASAAESRTLAETRDYLLPRLMSGKVRVAEVAEAGP